jgi:nitrogen-specific signal transduction histidine kinase/CheY-like chemotaxis protein
MIIGAVVVFRDVTDKWKTEQDMLKADKLESIGTLAEGIAHDFNNLLTGILGNISLANLNTNSGKISRNLSDAEKATLRARDLTNQLLTFANGAAPIKKIASIGEVLKETTTFTLSGSRVGCDFSIPDNLWAVRVDETQMSQVFNNIVINAIQAMPEGGVIKILAENVTKSKESALPLKEGKYIKISIEDQGVGIPTEHFQKIFDPYFTTKEKGSGLGLATSYFIVKNHNGYITAESKAGIGTIFNIYLPAYPKKILTGKKKKKKEKYITGEGKILVMDDEEIIREVFRSALTAIGYKVTVAKDGAEAIELYKKAKTSEHPFDAVIMDLTIPGGMGGKETIQKLRELDPDIKAIVSSGYSKDPIMSNFRKYGFKGVIPKPYKLETISATLYETLHFE